MEKIKTFLKTKWGILLTAVGEAAVGVMLLVDHVGFTDVIIIVSGTVLLVMTGIWTITYFRNPVHYKGPKKNHLAWALCSLTGGLYCLLGRQSIKELFPMFTIIYGVFLLGHSYYSIQMTVDMIRLNIRLWIMSMVISGIMLVLSLLILMNPFGTGEAVWTIAGISYIVAAVMSLLMLYLRASDKKVRERAESVQINASANTTPVPTTLPEKSEPDVSTIPDKEESAPAEK